MRTRLGLCVLVAFLAGGGAETAQAGSKVFSVSAGWDVAALSDRANRDWNPGMGFDLSAQLMLARTWDLRVDWGGRWLDGGNARVTNPDRAPRWGGRTGEITHALRVMPATCDLVYRFEDWSRGRFWIPYAAAGAGFYDMRATFRHESLLVPATEAGTSTAERHHNLFRVGWNGRAGVQLHRTSGLYLGLESAVHLIDTPGRWSPLWELSLRIGALVPGPRR